MALPNPNQVNNLIRRAFIYSSRVAEEGEELTSQMMQDGIQILNEIITIDNINGEPWNLLTSEDFNFVTGQEDLVLDGWGEINNARFLLGDIFIPIKLLNLNAYLNSSPLTTATGIPYVGYLQRTETGFILKVFLRPNVDYLVQIWGFKTIGLIVNSTDVFVGLSSFYVNYFLYELAYQLQNYYSIVHTPYVIYKRNQILYKLRDIKDTRIDVVQSASGGMAGNNIVNIYSRAGPVALSQGYAP